ncbi:hypothetical protein [Turicibacter sp. TJ11]|uniref:hypothetical protein n=1 Tax=Turicibacter sp. TJ11 TaxID=2806443 RepID=UPI001F275853|nr:hypothetical protein [Turicibacter sp. TJ11]
MEYLNLLILTVMLIILGLLLRNWQPPIKHQYIVILLLSIGSLLGNYMIDSWTWGFCIGGLTYYKDLLVTDFNLVASSFKQLLSIGKEIDPND